MGATVSNEVGASMTDAFMTEMFRTMNELVSDPELRSRFEDEIRRKLPPGESFWIDEAGIGHYNGNMFVSNVSLSAVDSSGVK